MTSVVGGPLVKAAAFSYGVRKALTSRDEAGKARESNGEPRRELQRRSGGKGRR
jgi:hypothetical protein